MTQKQARSLVNLVEAAGIEDVIAQQGQRSGNWFIRVVGVGEYGSVLASGAQGQQNMFDFAEALLYLAGNLLQFLKDKEEAGREPADT